MIDKIELLNDLNEAIAKKQRTMDDVITASTMLLASALRQLGKEHGEKRAVEIGWHLPKMVKDDSEVVSKYLGGNNAHEM